MSPSPTTSQPLDLRRAVAIGTPKAIDLWLDVVDDPRHRSDQLAELTAAEHARLGELMPVAVAAEMADTLALHVAVDTFRAVPTRRAADVLAALESDRAAEILRALDPVEREPLLAAVPAEHAIVLRDLLTWPAASAAAHMAPDVLTVDRSVTAAGAIAQVRDHRAKLRQDAHIGAYVFAVDGDGRLEGVVSFRDLVLADADTPVAELVEPDVITIAPLTDQEEAARTVVAHRLLAMPVVDDDGRLLGILTSDDASDIAEVEATEDAERQGGSQPLEVPYLRASPLLLWRKRIVWLLVLFVAAAYTGTVMQAFEDELEAVVVLAFFIPLLIGTGGNTGTQITTTLIRAMSTDNVRMRDVGRVLRKEMATGTLVAAAMAAAGLVRAWTLGVGGPVMLTVAVALVAIVLWASLISSVIPLLLRKLRVDPAVVSGPMISTIVDGTGLIIYFTTAKVLLPELAGL
ncbi:magnesium transporter [Litorihabitans aurantiacus]|uniref:Magnesium transporter MgtE n=1 Tax=Litorihabitans aurantiacus TaxID=1930061 RepID=A0AA37UU52_9MICO|nr:magnesium transporter [Litorihabitans aurantiacus]GMA30246.1 magnesium transporter MgtE [Litorihabitans aurantiacus]